MATRAGGWRPDDFDFRRFDTYRVVKGPAWYFGSWGTLGLVNMGLAEQKGRNRCRDSSNFLPCLYMNRPTISLSLFGLVIINDLLSCSRLTWFVASLFLGPVATAFIVVMPPAGPPPRGLYPYIPPH